MRCHVPTNYVFYEGHFTNYPVLAGGAQQSDDDGQRGEIESDEAQFQNGQPRIE